MGGTNASVRKQCAAFASEVTERPRALAQALPGLARSARSSAYWSPWAQYPRSQFAIQGGVECMPLAFVSQACETDCRHHRLVHR